MRASIGQCARVAVTTEHGSGVDLYRVSLDLFGCRKARRADLFFLLLLLIHPIQKPLFFLQRRAPETFVTFLWICMNPFFCTNAFKRLSCCFLAVYAAKLKKARFSV